MFDEKNAKGQVIDCQGLACPMPVIQTKKALETTPESLTVLVDNAAAKENVAKFASASGYAVQIDEQTGLYRLSLSHQARAKSLKTDMSISTAVDRAVLLIKQQTLGNGSEELGSILMKSFFVSLREAQNTPKTLILINGGVLLATDESPVLLSLQELQAKGVRILVCGTCLDYFDVKAKLAIGEVGNMYSLVELLTGADRVIVL